MPKTKTIEIDEVLPADSGEKVQGARNANDPASANEPPFSDQPFPDLRASLGWKARITLQLTQWFLILRTKSWGKWVIGPAVILAVLLAIPLAILTVFTLIIVSILRSFSAK